MHTKIRLTLPKVAMISVAVLIFSIGIQALGAGAWTPPTAPPPGGNVAAPINAGSAGQTKIGGLILNTGSAPNGLIVQNGNVGIGTMTPTANLDVKGTINTDNLLYLTDVNTSNSLQQRKAIYNWDGSFVVANVSNSGAWQKTNFSIDPTGNATFDGNTTFLSNVTARAGLTVNSICLNGTCRSTWPTGTGGGTTAPPPTAKAPTCTLSPVSGSSINITSGGLARIAYTTTGATSFSVNSGVGNLTPVASGQFNKQPTSTTLYTGTATGAGGTGTCNILVTITSPLPPTTFFTTAGAHTYKVSDSRVKYLKVTVSGSPGANGVGQYHGYGAPGAKVSGSIPVKYGEVLNITVGNKNGIGGGGLGGNSTCSGTTYGCTGPGGNGGGASIVRATGGVLTIVAGGGGGGGGANASTVANAGGGGLGGSSSTGTLGAGYKGADGEPYYKYSATTKNAYPRGGGGGTLTGGGAGGWTGAYGSSLFSGNAGAYLQGGSAARGSTGSYSGGGGGGGYYGGGGGGSNYDGSGAGGGGGSSYFSSNVINKSYDGYSSQAEVVIVPSTTP